MADRDGSNGLVSAGRIGLGVVVVLGMWFVAAIVALVALMTVGCGADATGLECDETFTPVALVVAGVLFLGSGVVGWAISGRRWMLLAPLVPIGFSVVSGLIASVA